MADTAPPASTAPFFLAIVGLLVVLSVSGGIGGAAGLAGSTSGKNAEGVAAELGTTTASARGGLFSRRSSGDTTNEGVPAYRVPAVETLPALNIEDRSAALRGTVNMFAGEKGVAFVVYGYDLKSVRTVNTGFSTLEAIPTPTSDKVRIESLGNRVKGEKEFSRRISNLIPDATYYYKLCVEHATQSESRSIVCGNVKSFATNSRYATNNRFYEPRVSVSRAYDVTAGAATLPGRVTMNDGVDGITFLVYGKDEEQIDNVENYASYRSVEEDDENLQRVRLGAGVRGQAQYAKTVTELDNAEIYYYRMCVEYTGERDGLVCSGVNQFTTDERNYAVLPYAETTSVSVVKSTVKLTSLVQMNSYRDGVVFVVVGTDQARVGEVTDSSSFANIRQSGYDLQKVLLDDDVDGTATYSKTIDFLVSGTYYYRTCVQYQGEDSYNRVKNFIRCDTARSFTVR